MHVGQSVHACEVRVGRYWTLIYFSTVAEEIAEVPFTPGHEMVGQVSARKSLILVKQISKIQIIGICIDHCCWAKCTTRVFCWKKDMCRESLLLRTVLSVHTWYILVPPYCIVQGLICRGEGGWMEWPFHLLICI